MNEALHLGDDGSLYNRALLSKDKCNQLNLAYDYLGRDRRILELEAKLEEVNIELNILRDKDRDTVYRVSTEDILDIIKVELSEELEYLVEVVTIPEIRDALRDDLSLDCKFDIVTSIRSKFIDAKFLYDDAIKEYHLRKIKRKRDFELSNAGALVEGSIEEFEHDLISFYSNYAKKAILLEESNQILFIEDKGGDIGARMKKLKAPFCIDLNDYPEVLQHRYKVSEFVHKYMGENALGYVMPF